jgi:hypothetical protein
VSFDFNVLAADPQTNAPIGACDHHQSFERYVVNPYDHRTLNYAGNTAINMRAPINGASAIQIWISGEQVKSTDPVYGWQVLSDPDRVQIGTAETFYKIVFNRPVRLVIPLIEVSYITNQDFCLKCSTLGSLNDFKPANTGSFVHVTQVNKLAQKALKWVLTSQDAFYPTFVCLLKSYLGKKLGVTVTDTDIQSEVLNALTTMQQVQQAQGTVQTLDPQEILQNIVSVSATLDPNDPTSVIVQCTISNYSGQSVPLGLTLNLNS